MANNIVEKLITCNKCGGNACSEISNDRLTVWTCFGCGFTTNSTLVEENIAKVEEVLPELYIALKVKDQDGKYWYPLAVTLEDKSMIFAEGTSLEDWKWTATKGSDGKPDMSTKKEYEQSEFMDALEYVGYFNLK